METLVFKCPGVAINDKIRGMNELRIRFKKSGDGSTGTYIRGLSTDPSAGNIHLKIISGTGYIGSSGVTELDIPNSGSTMLYITSDYCVLSITNFDLTCDCIGKGTSIIGSSSYTNNPKPIIDFNELKGHTQIKSIATSGVATGNLKDISDFSELAYFEIRNNTGGSDYAGNLDDLPDPVSTVIFGRKSNYNDGIDVTWSFSELIRRTNINYFVGDGLKCQGGDLYSLLASRDGSNFYMSATRLFSVNDIVPTFTCSYISGTSPIPDITIEYLNTYKSGNMDKESVVSFLNLLIDGVNVNKITVSDTIILGVESENVKLDADIVALVGVLANAGVTVELNV